MSDHLNIRQIPVDVDMSVMSSCLDTKTKHVRVMLGRWQATSVRTVERMYWPLCWDQRCLAGGYRLDAKTLLGGHDLCIGWAKCVMPRNLFR